MMDSGLLLVAITLWFLASIPISAGFMTTLPTRTLSFSSTVVQQPPCSTTDSRLSSSLGIDEEERLLLSEPALAAYIQAEVEEWLLGNTAKQGESIHNTAHKIAIAIKSAYEVASSEGILSNHGALIIFLSNELRGVVPWHFFSKFGTTPDGVARYCVDMIHHRLYRGTYTKTATPTGFGDIAARQAVGLPPSKQNVANNEGEEDEDHCLVEPPPELIHADCLWTESQQQEWLNRRYERIAMEGFRDPRRGNSGTSR